LLMTTAETGSIVLMVLSAARLGAEDMAALTILNSLRSLSQTIFVGAAARVRIATLLMESPSRARRVFWGCFWAMACSGFALASALFFLRPYIVVLYTGNHDLRHKVSTHFGWMLLVLVTNVIIGILKNGLAALNLFKNLLALEMVASWVVQLPAGIYFMFYYPGGGVSGFFIGYTLGGMTRVVAMLFFIVTADWEKQSALAKAASEMRDSSATPRQSMEEGKSDPETGTLLDGHPRMKLASSAGVAILSSPRAT